MLQGKEMTLEEFLAFDIPAFLAIKLLRDYSNLVSENVVIIIIKVKWILRKSPLQVKSFFQVIQPWKITLRQVQQT
jgi:hypothetical protein